MTTHDDLLYKKYKYYGFGEDITTLKLSKSVYDQSTNRVKVKTQCFNHYKFEGFYLIRFNSYYLNELKETMINYGKDFSSLRDKLFILKHHLNFGSTDYDYKKVIDEYCSVYDVFRKNNFIQIKRESSISNDPFCKKPITDIKLSKSGYELLEKFLLKQLKCENIIRIEHYPKRGFIMED